MGRTTPDLTGQHFGRLTVLARVPRTPREQGSAQWLCKCDPGLGGCGTLTQVGSNSLRTGRTQSCGCLLRDRLRERNTTHGLTGRGKAPRAYSSWTNMIRRCTKTDDPRYPDWGGRGITVDPRWTDFANFLADMGERPPGTTLNRKDNDGPYASWNCEWATPHEQMVNSTQFKLTPDLVTEVKRLRATGLSMRAIGVRVGLHHGTVSRALSGKTRQRRPLRTARVDALN